MANAKASLKCDDEEEEIGNAATWDIEKDVKSIVKSPLRNCILFGSKNCSKIRKSGKSENRGNQKIGEIGKSGKSGKSKNQEIDDVIKKSGKVMTSSKNQEIESDDVIESKREIPLELVVHSEKTSNSKNV